jgi:hypothetical protein
VNFAAITLCVAPQLVFIVVIVVYFIIGSVRKLLDTPSYIQKEMCLIYLKDGAQGLSRSSCDG